MATAESTSALPDAPTFMKWLSAGTSIHTFLATDPSTNENIAGYQTVKYYKEHRFFGPPPSHHAGNSGDIWIDMIHFDAFGKIDTEWKKWRGPGAGTVNLVKHPIFPNCVLNVTHDVKRISWMLETPCGIHQNKDPKELVRLVLEHLALERCPKRKENQVTFSQDQRDAKRLKFLDLKSAGVQSDKAVAPPDKAVAPPPFSPRNSLSLDRSQVRNDHVPVTSLNPLVSTAMLHSRPQGTYPTKAYNSQATYQHTYSQINTASSQTSLPEPTHAVLPQPTNTIPTTKLVPHRTQYDHRPLSVPIPQFSSYPTYQPPQATHSNRQSPLVLYSQPGPSHVPMPSLQVAPRNPQFQLSEPQVFSLRRIRYIVYGIKAKCYSILPLLDSTSAVASHLHSIRNCALQIEKDLNPLFLDDQTRISMMTREFLFGPASVKGYEQPTLASSLRLAQGEIYHLNITSTLSQVAITLLADLAIDIYSAQREHATLCELKHTKSRYNCDNPPHPPTTIINSLYPAITPDFGIPTPTPTSSLGQWSRPPLNPAPAPNVLESRISTPIPVEEHITPPLGWSAKTSSPDESLNPPTKLATIGEATVLQDKLPSPKETVQRIPTPVRRHLVQDDPPSPEASMEPEPAPRVLEPRFPPSPVEEHIATPPTNRSAKSPGIPASSDESPSPPMKLATIGKAATLQLQEETPSPNETLTTLQILTPILHGIIFHTVRDKEKEEYYFYCRLCYQKRKTSPKFPDHVCPTDLTKHCCDEHPSSFERLLEKSEEEQKVILKCIQGVIS